VWLDGSKTSPYAFYQFWLNAADADVYQFLRFFTFLEPSEIADLEISDKAALGRPAAQGVLAREVTKLVHGVKGLEAAERISDALFSGELGGLNAEDFEQLKLDGLPSTIAATDALGIIDVLVSTGLAASNRIARELVAGQAITVNGDRVTTDAYILSKSSAFFGRYVLLKRGKKVFHLVLLPV